MADTPKPNAAPAGSAGAPKDSNPMKPEPGLVTPATDVSVENTVGNPSPGTEKQRQWAANTTQSASAGDQNTSSQTTETFAKSKGEPIESVVLKKYYSDEGALIEVGSTVYYEPKENQPYPWPLMRPVNKSLEKELEADYNDYMDEKNEMLRQNADSQDAVRRLLAGGA
jgi:hypothetical protein